MTSYNREMYISEAIESVLLSTYPHFELIITDDCSKDRTVKIAKSYAAKDSRIKIYINEKNLGDYANRNRAASYAVGDWLMSVDSDDRIDADGIEKVLECMNQFPNSDFGMRYFTGDDLMEVDSATAIRKHLLKSPFLATGPGGTIIRRAFFNKINGYPEKYGPANDMYFNLKATSQSSIVLIPFDFHFYRRHDGQEINNWVSYMYNFYNYFKDAINELNLYITDAEKKWLIHKNDRRFLVKMVNLALKKRQVSKTFEISKKAHFGLSQIISALFYIK